MGTFPGGPVVKIVLPMLVAWVPILLRELDPPTKATTTKIKCSQKKMVENV